MTTIINWHAMRERHEDARLDYCQYCNVRRPCDAIQALDALQLAERVVEAASPIAAKYVVLENGELGVIVDGHHWTDEQMKALIAALAAHDAEMEK